MKRRIIAVLAAAALTATLGAGISPASAVEPDGATYVALGDSVASGNGILPYMKDDEPLCLRSKKSYPMLLAKEFGLSIVTEACSGEGTADVFGQLQELVVAGAIGSDTQLVTLTVGVNDVMWQIPGVDAVLGWGEALIACSDAPLFPPGSCEGALYLAGLSLNPPEPTPSLSERITALIGAIRQLAPTAEIVVTGYPLLFGDDADTCNVGLFVNADPSVREEISYSRHAMDLINQAVAQANALIYAGVAAAAMVYSDVRYVDVNMVPPGVEGFDGHGLCDSGEAWISGLLPPTAKPHDRGFHPNPVGQRAYADIVAAALGW